jgi:hypothetical protein
VTRGVSRADQWAVYWAANWVDVMALNWEHQTAVWKESQMAVHWVGWRACQQAEAKVSMTAQRWAVCSGNQRVEHWAPNSVALKAAPSVLQMAVQKANLKDATQVAVTALKKVFQTAAEKVHLRADSMVYYSERSLAAMMASLLAADWDLKTAPRMVADWAYSWVVLMALRWAERAADTKAERWVSTTAALTACS